MDDMSIPVELYFSARRLRDLDYFSKSDPCLKFYCQKSNLGGIDLVGTTETISNNINPDWKKSIKTDYIFEIKQNVIIEILDDDGSNSYQLIGKANTTMGAILGANNQALALNLVDEKGKNTGEVVVRAQKCENSSESMRMKWCGTKIANMDSYFDFWNKSDPYLKFMKLRKDNTLVEVARTQVIQNNHEPQWKVIEIPINRLVDVNQHDAQFRIECWDEEDQIQNHKFIGGVYIKIQKLKAYDGPINFTLQNPNIGKPGVILLQQFEVVKTPNFIDFLKSGLQLNLAIAIDFTGSNGHPLQSNSLHFISQQLNQYQLVIQAVWSIIENYDSDKSIPAFGFGAKPRFPNLNENGVNHCFPITGDYNNIQVKGFDNLMKAYTNAIKSVQFAGPTLFGPILNSAFKNAQLCKKSYSYQILLILTDGQIHDMGPTISTIIKGANLPLSIIIVGVGNDDFASMKKLDGDQNGLKDSEGRVCPRDIVQFVPFNQYKGNVLSLTQQLLREIPSQVCQYMKFIGKGPVNMPPVNVEALFKKN